MENVFYFFLRDLDDERRYFTSLDKDGLKKIFFTALRYFVILTGHERNRFFLAYRDAGAAAETDMLFYLTHLCMTVILRSSDGFQIAGGETVAAIIAELRVDRRNIARLGNTVIISHLYTGHNLAAATAAVADEARPVTNIIRDMRQLQ